MASSVNHPTSLSATAMSIRLRQDRHLLAAPVKAELKDADLHQRRLYMDVYQNGVLWPVRTTQPQHWVRRFLGSGANLNDVVQMVVYDVSVLLTRTPSRKQIHATRSRNTASSVSTVRPSLLTTIDSDENGRRGRLRKVPPSLLMDTDIHDQRIEGHDICKGRYVCCDTD